MNNLRIIADDLGLEQCVNEGIVLALKNGWISGASLMVNGRAFEDAVARSQDLVNLNLGLHVVLVEEKGLFSGNNSSLTNSAGFLIPNHKVFFIKYLLNLVKLKDIEQEARLQLAKMLGAGLRPAFINSHQHLHLLPGITNIFIKLAKENSISYIRTVAEPVSAPSLSLFRKGEALFLSVLSYWATKKIKKVGLKTNDYFTGFSKAGNMEIEDCDFAKRLATKYPGKMIEVGFHPGFENKELKIRYQNWGAYHWQSELKLLEEQKNGI